MRPVRARGAVSLHRRTRTRTRPTGQTRSIARAVPGSREAEPSTCASARPRSPPDAGPARRRRDRDGAPALAGPAAREARLATPDGRAAPAAPASRARGRSATQRPRRTPPCGATKSALAPARAARRLQRPGRRASLRRRASPHRAVARRGSSHRSRVSLAAWDRAFPGAHPIAQPTHRSAPDRPCTASEALRDSPAPARARLIPSPPQALVRVVVVFL